MFDFYVYADCKGTLTEYEVKCDENSALKTLAKFAVCFPGKLVLDVRRKPIKDKYRLESMQRELTETRRIRAAKGWKND